MFEPTPATRSKADQLDTPGKRTRLIAMQSPQKFTEHSNAVGARNGKSQATEDRVFADDMLSQMNSDVIIHANKHGNSGSEAFTGLLSDQPKQLGCGVVTSESRCQAVPPDHKLEVCVDLDWRTLIHALQAQIGAVTQRTGKVIMTKLDVDQQKNIRDAMTREIQSCHEDAVGTALQEQRTSQNTTADHWLP